MQERSDDYRAMGVGQVWVLDPVRRQAFVPDRSGGLEQREGELTVPGSAIRLSITDIFAEFDSLASGD